MQTFSITEVSWLNQFMLWGVFLFAGLLGIRVLYIIVRIIILLVSPETNNRFYRYSISNDAKRYFRFLLEKGYKISNVKYIAHHLAGWHIELTAPDNKMSIVLDEQEWPLLVFGADVAGGKYQISVEALVYYLTRGQTFIGNSGRDITPTRSRKFKRVANLLKTYIYQIESFLSDEFEKVKHQLSNFQKQYDDLLIREHEKKLGASE